jgi:hypothetical protein
MTDEERYQLANEAASRLNVDLFTLAMAEAEAIDPTQANRIAVEIIQQLTICVRETAPARDPEFKRLWDARGVVSDLEKN